MKRRSILRMPGSDRLLRWLEPLPQPLVIVLAKLVACPRSPTTYPGWYCGIDYYGETPGQRLRTAIWKYCNEREMESPVRIRYLKSLRINSYLGNDISQCLFVGGCYEPNEFAFLDGYLREGMTFVDVGANEGLYTLFAAKKVGKCGRVLALEPSSRDYGRLMENLRINRLRNVRALKVAASDVDGKACLHVAGYMHEGHNTIGKLTYGVRLSHVEEIEVRQIDDILPGEGVEKVDAIKIDVEGAEEAVLKGAAAMIERDRPMILIEVFDRALRTLGSSAERVIKILRSNGYYLYSFSSLDGQPALLSGAPSEGENVLALPELYMGREGPCRRAITDGRG